MLKEQHKQQRHSHKIRNKSSGKKILNTTFYPDQKGINKFIKGKSEPKGNKQVKTKNFRFDNAQKYLYDD